MSSDTSIQATAGRRQFLKQAAATALVAGLPNAWSETRMGSDIVSMDAVALSKAIANRSISCREVMLAYLAQIDRLNPKVNAIVSLQDREGLLKQADERDAQLKRGERMGWMHGFPQAPKDLANTAGIVTTQGSPILKDYVPKTDAIVVERARKSGAILIGKTNTPEFGLGSHTYNKVFGTTLNAWDQGRSAGGRASTSSRVSALNRAAILWATDIVTAP